jgi:mono/diheme cytochrome c family protein
VRPAAHSPARLSRLTPRVRLAALLAVATGLASSAAGYAVTGGGADRAARDAPNLRLGKKLYRRWCGQCHSLTQALAAGFGSDTGLGQDGGPSFDTLRVPFNLSVVAVTTPFAGHEIVFKKMTWTEVKQVASYVETVTKHHPGLAQPIDG